MSGTWIEERHGGLSGGLAVRRFGSGSRMYVGLPGWGGSHTAFRGLVERMPEGACLYVPDLPGYGGSPAPRPVTLAGIVEPVLAWLRELAPARLTLLGNCSGGLVGALAARELPQRVARLVLVDPFAYLPWYFRLFTWGEIGRYAYLTSFGNPLGRWLTNGALRSKRKTETHMTEGFAAVDHEVTLGYLRALGELELEDLSGLTLPVDLAYGERTFRAVKASVARFQACWPQARAFELAGAGHLPLLEAPDALAEILFGTMERMER